MSRDQGFEQEWAQVKRELNKLKGQTVYTVGDCSPNEILNADAERGLNVQRGLVDKNGLWVQPEDLPNPKWIKWEEIEDRYRRLRQYGKLEREEAANNKRIGASCRAILSTLTNVHIAKDCGKTILRYAEVAEL